MIVKSSLCHEPDSRAGGEASYLGVSCGKAATIVEEGMATHSSILAWRIPWTEEPGGLRSIESQRVGTQLKQLRTHTRTGVHCKVAAKAPLEAKVLIWTQPFHGHLLSTWLPCIQPQAGAPLPQHLSLPTFPQVPTRFPFPYLRKECRQGELSDFLHEYFSNTSLVNFSKIKHKILILRPSFSNYWQIT